MRLGMKGKLGKTVICFLMLFLLIAAGVAFVFPRYSQGETLKTNSKKVVLIAINGVSLGDYTQSNLPNINGLLQEGAVALMNTRPGGTRNAANSYATIGAGEHILSSGFAGDAFNTKSEFDEISAYTSYIARTGMEPPLEGVVTLGISQIKIANEKEGIMEGPGALGEALKQAGLKTAVLGNGDVPESFNRDAVTIAMDKWGRVDYGNVSRNILNIVPESALDYQTDYQALLKEFKSLYAKADFLVVETGDTFRAEELANTAFPEILAREKKSALERADKFVGQVLGTVDLESTLVMLVSPCPSAEAIAGNDYMTPLVMYTGEQVPGFLTSGTTRREGIVANTDIAPTVLSYLGVTFPEGMEGRVLETLPNDNVVNTLSQMSKEMIFVYKARPVLVKGYVGVQIIVMVLVIAMMVLWPKLLRYLRPLLLWLMAVPLSLLLIGAVRFSSLPAYAFLAVLVTSLLVVAAYKMWRHRDVDLFIILGIATAVIVLIDTIAGSPLMKNSTLGYDAMSGARYYGIGNEYEGVIIGAEIIAVAALWEKYHETHRSALKYLTIAFWGITILLMGAPQIGSNVGGTIAAVAAFIFTYMRLTGTKVGVKQLLAIGGSVSLAVVAFAIFDMNQSVEAQSHLGRMANDMKSGGWQVFWEIAVRKLKMNAKLIRYTIWSRVFLIMLAALAVSFYRPIGLMEKVRRSYPFIFEGLLGILVGSAVGLAVNDSGIVAAATMMIFGMAPLIYLMGREREQDVDSIQMQGE